MLTTSRATYSLTARTRWSRQSSDRFVWLDDDDDDNNLGDLRGQPSVRFVSESADLVVAMRAIVEGEVGSSAPTEFFTLDPGCPDGGDSWRPTVPGDLNTRGRGVFG